MAAGPRQLQGIVLTEKEQQIFDRLLEVVHRYGVVDRYGERTQLRVAGGWVRDKLLGQDSADIDIVLNMTGQNFVQKYLEFMDEEQKRVGVSQWYAIFITLIKKFGRLLDHFGLGTQLRIACGWARDKLLGRDSHPLKYSKLMDVKQEEASSKKKKKGGGIIPCNPDKSKHLETATMCISGINIDFVNLRSEKYVENSRIPAVETGTAKDDAFRRDLTINSLFYNINTKLVEDLTERGLEDLKNCLIATPLPAKDTFLDDPLRVLRAIRFAARFSFTLAENLKEAASDEDVKSALRSKISRERIGKEVDSMMSGKDPVNAMCYIRDLGLFYVVFEFPEKPDPPVLDNHDWLCVLHIEAAWNLVQLIGCSVFRGGSDSESQRRLCLYSALFYPVRNMVYMVKRSKKDPVVKYIIQNSLKYSISCDANTIINVHTASEKFAELILVLESNENLETVREKLNDEYLEVPVDMVKCVLAGLILCEIKEHWRVALLISTLSYPQVGSSSQDELYLRVERLITDLGLEGVWGKMEKPLLDGDDIRTVLQIPKGRLVAEWKQRVLKWQLAHPEGTKEECEEWMKRPQHHKCQKVEM